MSSSRDAKALKDLESLFRRIEASESEGVFSSALIEEARTKLRELRDHERIEIAKLAGIASHLHPRMTGRTLLNFLVPLERALEKSLRDDDFLVRGVDSPPAGPRETIPLRFLLDHWRSAFNVGSVFRSADGLGIERLHLTGYTPTPGSTKTAKSALGAEESVPWDHAENPREKLAGLRDEGFRLIALETAEKATPLGEAFPRMKTVFVLGNERFGLGTETLALCDEVRVLPLAGHKNSMNAAVVAALAGYEWRRQWFSNP